MQNLPIKFPNKKGILVLTPTLLKYMSLSLNKFKLGFCSDTYLPFGPNSRFLLFFFWRSSQTWAYEQTFFPSAQKIFPFSNPNPFPFEPKETKIWEDNFSEMKEREESSSIFVVGERIYNVKFNMNAQTWLLIHYWLFLLEYFFSSQGGPWSKRLCRPYAYGYILYQKFDNHHTFRVKLSKSSNHYTNKLFFS